ncbi:MAG: class I SAM-dependent methyltransferase [Ignavibacteriaceae bacterium]
MNSDILNLICDPVTHDSLELKSERDAHGRVLEYLINSKTGVRFSIQNDIPIFLHEEVYGSNKRYQALYNRIAPFYDLITSLYSRWKGMSVENRLREYLDELEVKDNSLVLEVSVGTGRNLQFLPHNAKYFGLDISWGMLKKCQHNSAKWKLDTSLFMGAAEQLPFKDEAFDTVFHFGGINFFNDKAAAIREMVRVAKPGTKFVIGDENEKAAQRYEKIPVSGKFYDRRKEVISAPVDLLPAGIQEIKIKDISGGDLYCLSFRKPG